VIRLFLRLYLFLMLPATAAFVGFMYLTDQVMAQMHAETRVGDGDLEARAAVGRSSLVEPIAGAFNAMTDRVQRLLECIATWSRAWRTSCARRLRRSSSTWSSRAGRAAWDSDSPS
jgi:methyl-accepting chemotaxis protein